MELNDAHLRVKFVSTSPTRRVSRTIDAGSGVATVPTTCVVAGGFS
jgi:hypothetical protein